MQTCIHVVSKGSASLRAKVRKHPKLVQHGLRISEHKNQKRPNGWSKIHMKGEHGAINIDWDASSRVLLCRIVNKGGKPDAIAGAFIGFLLARLSNQIAAIHILPA